MLRVFSSIRQKLLNENKSVKYLKYAIGEVVLIMIGIFLALQLDNWNDRRLDRIEEREILQRIVLELEQGITMITESGLRWVKDQKESLEEVNAVFKGKPIASDMAFLATVALGANAGWGQQNIVQVTYGELVSSGKFGLIQRVELRNRIAQYYDQVSNFEKRASLRVNDYAKVAYDLVPRKSENMDWNSEDQVKEGLSEEEYAALAQAVLESELNHHVTAALNRTLLMEINWIILRDAAEELIAEIEIELNQ